MSASETCTRCGEEVRWGVRNGVEAYWHRLNVDHVPVFGYSPTAADLAEIERQLDLPRVDANGEPYTTRAYDIAKYKDKADREAAQEEEHIEIAPIPEPEIASEPVEKTSEHLPGGAKQIWNLAEKNGWTIISTTRSRGPRVHASHGTLLSISDFFLIKMRLDGTDRAAVASWTDGKFEFAYTVTIDHKNHLLYPTKANSDGLKLWIKGETT